jgi:thioredoxin-related protein
MRFLLASLVAAASLHVSLALAHASGNELVMVEEPGCLWCARWNAEIAPAYSRTPEGRAAPLRRIGMHAPRPADIAFDGPLRITPTFVLVSGGEEVARLEGYPGDEFFWAMLAQMLDALPSDGDAP